MTLITKDLGLVQALHSGSTPPQNTKLLWYDTNTGLHKFYIVATQTWTPLSQSAFSGDYNDLINKPLTFYSQDGVLTDNRTVFTNENSLTISTSNAFQGGSHLTMQSSQMTVGYKDSMIEIKENLISLGAGFSQQRTLQLSNNKVAIGYASFSQFTPQALLDIKAHGALSTDIAFKVRNSANTADIFRITGNNRLELGNLVSIIGGGVGVSFISNISIGGSVRLDAPFSLNNQEVFNGQRIHLATTYETNGTNLIQIQNGTAPTTGLIDAFKMYSADITEGNAAPHFRTENGDIIKLFKAVVPSLSTTTINTGDADTDVLIEELIDALKNVGIIGA